MCYVIDVVQWFVCLEVCVVLYVDVFQVVVCILQLLLVCIQWVVVWIVFDFYVDVFECVQCQIFVLFIYCLVCGWVVDFGVGNCQYWLVYIVMDIKIVVQVVVVFVIEVVVYFVQCVYYFVLVILWGEWLVFVGGW